MLGLPAGAAQKEIYDAAASLALSFKLGVEKSFPGDLRWLGPLARTETDVREALGRLTNPPQRILERLFWFGVLPDVRPLTSLAGLAPLLKGVSEKGGPTARHDAALLGLAVLFRLDPNLYKVSAWQFVIETWREVAEHGEFWSWLVAADLKGDYEQLVTHGEVRELRRRTLRLVTTPVADRAKDALARDDLKVCANALSVLRGAALPERLFAEYENDVLGLVENRLEELVRRVLSAAKAINRSDRPAAERKAIYDACLNQFDREVKPELLKLLRLAGSESYLARRAFDAAAGELNDLAVDYGNAGEREMRRLLYRSARALSPPGSAMQVLIEENVRNSGDGESLSPRTEADYHEELLRELGDSIFVALPSEKKAERKVKAEESEGGGGCLIQGAIYLLLFLCCLLSEKCWNPGKRRTTTTPTPPAMTFNFNYNVPPPILAPPEVTTAYSTHVPRMSAAELRRSMRKKQVVVVDARGRENYDAGHVPGAISLPEDEVGVGHARLPSRRQIVVYSADEADGAGERVALSLRAYGFDRVYVLRGGYRAWVAAGGRSGVDR